MKNLGSPSFRSDARRRAAPTAASAELEQAGGRDDRVDDAEELEAAAVTASVDVSMDMAAESPALDDITQLEQSFYKRHH